MKLQNTLLMALALSQIISATAQAQTLIRSLPYTISQPGDYLLASDLTGNPIPSTKSFAGFSIVILPHSGSVTLDFNGHTLTNAAIQVYNANNVTVQNGTIQGGQLSFYNNTGGGYDEDCVVQNMNFNGDNSTVQAFCRNGTFRNNRFLYIGISLTTHQPLPTTSELGFEALSMGDGGGNRIENNVFNHVNGIGIEAGPTDLVKGNLVAQCAKVGIYGGLSEANAVVQCATPFVSGVQLTNSNIISP